ncbi:MAG TPA: transcriptional regulator [Methylovirgula sp.]|nr:transcriptional regulator [Methylovirgula sp.]
MTNVKIAEIAALLGDPGRAAMLTALMDGRALPASELASLAGVMPQTASGHLAQLVAGRLLIAEPQGRNRYYRLASSQVAQTIEALMVLAGDGASRGTRVPKELREARTCYDHLGGRLAVALADKLQDRGFLVLTEEAGEVTPKGRDFLAELGVTLASAKKRQRALCRACLDWSERRPHIAGLLGTALLNRSLELRWIARAAESRAVTITPRGRRAFAETFGIRF